LVYFRDFDESLTRIITGYPVDYAITGEGWRTLINNEYKPGRNDIFHTLGSSRSINYGICLTIEGLSLALFMQNATANPLAGTYSLVFLLGFANRSFHSLVKHQTDLMQGYGSAGPCVGYDTTLDDIQNDPVDNYIANQSDSDRHHRYACLARADVELRGLARPRSHRPNYSHRL
jgi:hypothetical protein